MRIAQITDPHMTAGPPAPGGYDAAAALAAVLAEVDAAAARRGAADRRPRGGRPARGVPPALRASSPASPVPMRRCRATTTTARPSPRARRQRDRHRDGAGPLARARRRPGAADRARHPGAAGSDAGVLGDAQLAWVADRLGRDDPRPVLIFMHHPPFPLGLPLDWTRCADGDELARLVLGASAGARRGLRACAPRGAGRLGRHLGGVCPPVAWEIPLDLPRRSAALPGAAEPGLPAARLRSRARPRQPYRVRDRSTAFPGRRGPA